MLTILPLLSFSWEGDWESTLLSLFLQGHCEREHIFSTLDGSFCVQGHPTPSALCHSSPEEKEAYTRLISL